MTTRAKLLHLAAQIHQLRRELWQIGLPVSEGGAADISFAASHQLGVVHNSLGYHADTLTRLAKTLSE